MTSSTEVTVALNEKKSYDYGIRNHARHNFIYDEVRADWKKERVLYERRPYLYYSRGDESLLRELHIPEEDLDSVYSTVVTEALNRRDKLADAFLKNPFLPASEKFFKTTSSSCCGRGCGSPCVEACLVAAERNPRLLLFLCCYIIFGDCLPPFFTLIGWLFYYPFYVWPVGGILYLIDSCSGKTDEANRGSPKEKEWLESAILAHPDLETPAITAYIKSSLEKHAEHLRVKYGSKADFEVVEEFNEGQIEEDGKKHPRQEILIRVTRKGGADQV